MLSPRLPEDSKVWTRSPCLGFPGGIPWWGGTLWGPADLPLVRELGLGQPCPAHRVSAAVCPSTGLPCRHIEAPCVDSRRGCRTGSWAQHPPPTSDSDTAAHGASELVRRQNAGSPRTHGTQLNFSLHLSTSSGPWKPVFHASVAHGHQSTQHVHMAASSSQGDRVSPRLSNPLCNHPSDPLSDLKC